MNIEKRSRVTSADDVRKLLIKSVVQRSRRVLVEGLEQRLASLGIFKNGTRLDVSSLPDQWEAQRERPAIDAALADGSRRHSIRLPPSIASRVSPATRGSIAGARHSRAGGPRSLILARSQAWMRQARTAFDSGESGPDLTRPGAAREVAEPLLWQ